MAAPGHVAPHDQRAATPPRPPTIPWIADTAIHHGASSIPLGAEPDSFVQLNQGYVVRTRLDEQDDARRLDFVRTDGDSSDAQGAVSMPATKGDHTWVMWTRAGFEPGGAKVVYYASAQEDGSSTTPGWASSPTPTTRRSDS
ncbi:hypothetical protein [Actinopolymorpha pittospori]|uniref:Uncharacterized protein n=1 Tax=Actinopolymorpha pittospori TaxID=648752 RepID=A0A927MNT9_9ACTN|nr:hypothetical protein [Actinopolymorpha pittospori]MBE1604115.1 hypothetical protein [Actinopolymorpha pittospori]